MKAVLVPVLLAVTAGGLVTIASAAGLSFAFGLACAETLSLSTKSVTAPTAILLTSAGGGDPSLAILGVAGPVGSLLLGPLSTLLRTRDPRATGLSAGVSAHTFGMLQARRLGAKAELFSIIGMTVNVLVTTLVVSVLPLARC